LVKKPKKVWNAGAACIAVLLVLHGFLAGFAPCPYRSNLSIAIAGTGQEHPHTAHANHAGSGQQSDMPCPFDLMHALFGVFRAAPAPRARTTLASPLVITVSADPISPQWRFSRRFDPPPRTA
jgi:hypothetical protein